VYLQNFVPENYELSVTVRYQSHQPFFFGLNPIICMGQMAFPLGNSTNYDIYATIHSFSVEKTAIIYDIDNCTLPKMRSGNTLISKIPYNIFPKDAGEASGTEYFPKNYSVSVTSSFILHY
jgi:hypothetical protein